MCVCVCVCVCVCEYVSLFTILIFDALSVVEGEAELSASADIAGSILVTSQPSAEEEPAAPS